MKRHLAKFIAVLSIVVTSSVVPLSNFVSAASVGPNELHVQSSSIMDKNGNGVFDTSTESTTRSVEILEGTDQNWIKLKVTEGNRVDYVERKVEDGTQSITIINAEGAPGDNHVVQSDGNNVFIDNELAEKNEVSLPLQKNSRFLTNSVAALDPNITWYVKDYVEGSFKANFEAMSMLISVITAYMSVPISIAYSIGSAIFDYHIEQTYFTKLTLWDQAPYHPTYFIATDVYSDRAFTNRLSHDEYYL